MNHRFCVAPMMDRTDRHERYFLRTISTEALLYTEMIHANAVIKGDTPTLLNYHPKEHPLAIQLGGSDHSLLAEASQISEDYAIKEENLNVGCPSDRVQKGRFGAILMKEPELVAQCIDKMIGNTSIPITVKCRIGVDDMNEDTGLDNFINHVKDAGCKTFIVHARKAWLKGLSPKENREIPPINYERVYRLKEKFSDGFKYYDAQIDDKKLVEMNIEDASVGSYEYGYLLMLSLPLLILVGVIMLSREARKNKR